ncbi:MAG: response regulator [Candidatus Omnitrophica bacterium]|nr:response regulator [Candidatus Omnitrophota bacterium]
MGKRILVVDDEPDIIEQLRIRLNASGYDVISAENGVNALKQAKEGSPDLIILDVMMPPPNGFQVARELKDSVEYSRIPIIMVTAKSTESDQFWGMESGADAYLTKPYNSAELMGKIKSLLGE